MKSDCRSYYEEKGIIRHEDGALSQCDRNRYLLGWRASYRLGIGGSFNFGEILEAFAMVGIFILYPILYPFFLTHFTYKNYQRAKLVCEQEYEMHLTKLNKGQK